MTKLTKYLFTAFFLIVNLSCGGGTSVDKKTDDLPTDNTASDAGTDSGNSDSGSSNSNIPSVCDNDSNSFTLNLSQLNPTSLTNQPAQELRIQATHDIDLIAYLIRESDNLPEASDASWDTINATTALDLNISHTIASGDGDKNLFLFVKDSCNRVSQASNTIVITLDTTPPIGSLTLDNGNKFTLKSQPNVTVDLLATDTGSGIVAYYLSTSNTLPNLESDVWISIANTQNLTFSNSIALTNPLDQKKFVYAWVKDAAGNISNVISASIEIMRFIPYEIPQFGAYPSLAINPYDQPYLVAYSELSRGIAAFTIINDVFYVIDFNDFNDPTDLTDATGTFAAMKIDSNNFAHIAYHDATHNKLKYARVDLNKPINSFLDQTMETVTDGGIGASIALDSNNNPHITHQYNTIATGNKSIIAYITKNNNSWISTDIFNLGGNFFGYSTSALAIDNNDDPLIITDQTSHAMLHEYIFNDGLFTSNIFDPDDAGYPNIKIAPSGNVYVAYDGFDIDYTAKLAVKTENGWAFTSPHSGNANYGVSLAIDSAENAYLLHSNANEQHVALDIYHNNEWQKYIIAPNTITRPNPAPIIEPNLDIAIDSNDRIHLVYYDVINHRLTYGTTADAE